MVTREEASKFQAQVDKTFCIWCGENAPPVSPNKKYCAECDRYCLRECKHCHKPYDNLKFFEGDSTSCRSCLKKIATRKMKREAEKKKPIQEVSSDESAEVLSDGDSEPDDEGFTTDDRAQAVDFDDDDDDDTDSSASSDSKRVKKVKRKKIKKKEKRGKSEEDGDDSDGGVARKKKKKKHHQEHAVTGGGKTQKQALITELLGDKKSAAAAAESGPKRRVYNKKRVPTEMELELAENELLSKLFQYKRSFPHKQQVSVYITRAK